MLVANMSACMTMRACACINKSVQASTEAGRARSGMCKRMCGLVKIHEICSSLPLRLHMRVCASRMCRRVGMCSCMCASAEMHVRVRLGIYPYTYYRWSCGGACMHVRIRMCAWARVGVQMHACVLIRLRTSAVAYTYKHVYIYTYIYMLLFTRICLYIPIYIYTYTHE